MKKAIVMLGLCLIGLPREGHVSEIFYETATLDQVVNWYSHTIVEAEYRGENDFKVLSVIKAGPVELKPGQTIQVDDCGTEILKNSPEGESPIFQRYPGADLSQSKKGKKVILFLTKGDPNWEFSVHPGYVETSELKAIQASMAKGGKLESR